MTTVKELMAALSGLPQEQIIYYTFWTQNDIDEILKEREEAPTDSKEYELWVNRMNADESLSREAWEAVSEYITLLLAERTNK